MSKLKLNDFKSFENFLFTKEEKKKSKVQRWKKYISKSKTEELLFKPPLSKPTTIEEFQLCHYAYWMFIAYVIKGTSKTPIFTSHISSPAANCYACEYTKQQPINYNSPEGFDYCNACPVKSITCHSISGCKNNAFLLWKKEHDTLTAMAVAKTIWKIPK